MIKVYLKPVNDWVEITDDVISVGTIGERLEVNDYETGVYRNSDTSIKVYNRGGLYLGSGSLNSIFETSRQAEVRITYDNQSFNSTCGTSKCGYSLLGETEIIVFEGVVSDEGTREDISREEITFRVLGNTTLLSKAEAPTVSVGQSFETVITNCLTASGLSLEAIDLGFDTTIDFWEDNSQTAEEVIKLMLAASNSIMAVNKKSATIENRDKVKPIKKTFFGQASTDGAEDIINIGQASNGLNKTFNLTRWKDTSLNQKNVDSIDDFGVRVKEVDLNFITNTTKRTNILNSIVTSVGLPKKEFSLTVPLNYENLGINMLDTLAIDYPTILFAPIGESIPIYGISAYGESFYPFADFTITIDKTDSWKVQSRQVNFNNTTITFGLRGL